MLMDQEQEQQSLGRKERIGGLFGRETLEERIENGKGGKGVRRETAVA